MIDPLPTDMFQAGQVLNNTYEIGHILGRGGTGEVYLARNLITGRVFAIKALSAQFSNNADYIELMKREEEIRSIVHDAVVRYNECSRVDNGHVILVMDYIDGVSLADEMKRRQIDPRELLTIAHRIAEGLVAAHAHGIIHRDLSPDNIILRNKEPEEAMLIDFGIAKDTAAGSRTIVGNEFAGKYEYAAPEQLEGNAHVQSDLYALGATLLAAFRGDTPFLGTTPGEIVRRKQVPLDTEGVPEPLKRLIDTLADPAIEKRPQTAQSTVILIDSLLGTRSGPLKKKKPASGGNRNAGTKRKLSLPLMAGLTGIAALVGAGFAFRDAILGPSVQTVTPYTLEVSKSIDGRTMMSGFAPDADAADTLTSVFASATNAPREAASIELALGTPSKTWAVDIAEVISHVASLDRWQVAASDRIVSVSGLARDFELKSGIEDAIDLWETASGLTARTDILVGPETLQPTTLASLLHPLETCGILDAPVSPLALGEPVRITGTVAATGDQERIASELTPRIGSRPLDLRLEVLNANLCTIRSVLPPSPSTDFSIWLGKGPDRSPNLTGVFHTGENPLAEVLIPASIADGYLRVLLINTEGKVFNVLPNVGNGEQRISRLGSIEGGLRRVPVLHPFREARLDPGKVGFNVIDDDYGKNEIVAILSETPLFELRGPRDESVEAVAEALSEALSSPAATVIGIASRIIETRP